jgi:hypothetical protein
VLVLFTIFTDRGMLKAHGLPELHDTCRDPINRRVCVSKSAAVMLATSRVDPPEGTSQLVQNVFHVVVDAGRGVAALASCTGWMHKSGCCCCRLRP